jgi:hypothetical protein
MTHMLSTPINTTDFRDVMLDLETLGRAPGCVVLSIGAIAFNLQGLGTSFHQIITVDSCQHVSLGINAETLNWWQRQTPEAQTTLLKAQAPVKRTDPDTALPLEEVLLNFKYYLDAQTGGLEEVRLWGNGAGFDQPILAAAYRAQGWREQPWRFFNERCYRTLKNLHPDLGYKREGTHHNALHDALTQANHAALLLGRQLRQSMADDVVSGLARLVRA